jgi:predicted PurR-regulated permease PerM
MADTANADRRSAPSHTTVLLAAAVIAGLYFGRDLLIPLALAVLLTFVLAPLVGWTQRIGIPRVPSILFVVLLAAAGIGGVGLVVGSQVVELARNLPTYQQNISNKIRSLKEGVPGGGIFDRAAEAIRDLEKEFAREERGPPQPSAPEVRVRENRTALDMVGIWAVPLLGPVGIAGLVLVLVIFFLLGREDLRNRAIRLMGGELHATTEAIDEGSQRVSRYLLMQLLINTGTSIPFGIALYLIGVPNALLWAVLAIVLRFIPYIGPLIAALFPAIVAAAVDPGWTMLLWTIGVYVAMEAITNNFIEPRVYGASTGISEVAIIVSAVFWTALWGPVGLFLATPLTVCLAVLGRHVPRFHFLEVMLGKVPVLSPVEHFYQRLLAGDAGEATESAEKFTKDQPLAKFYDEVGLPALRLADQDRQRLVLTAERRAVITETVLEVIDDLEEVEEDEGKDAAAPAKGKEKPESRADKAATPPLAPPPPAAAPAATVLCLAARSGFDFAAASMMAQLLRRRGFEARALPADAISLSGISSLKVDGVDCICLSYVGLAGLAQVRHGSRRLRRHAPATPIVVGLWPGQGEGTEPGNLAKELRVSRVVHALGAGVDAILELTRPRAEIEQEPAAPADEAQRLAELRRLGLLDAPTEARFDRVTKRLAEAFGAPISLLALGNEEQQFWKTPSDDAANASGPRPPPSIFAHVVDENEMLVVEDVLKDKRFADDPFVRERGIRFYAGAPLRGDDGSAFGSVSVIDTVPRKVSEQERDLLRRAAAEVEEEIERGKQIGEEAAPAAAARRRGTAD